ncbi:glycine-rich cell wall structural protein 2-like [Vicia villosa]|uniref:glycine-rich cell wall structural protein 2-like n=1 Tax=Vicia villosa TaxID=3911 RepID=UPI00273B25C3|nr:glycine-rich cell wall structural protein 2-like [Vicia villosa]
MEHYCWKWIRVCYGFGDDGRGAMAMMGTLMQQTCLSNLHLSQTFLHVLVCWYKLGFDLGWIGMQRMDVRTQNSCSALSGQGSGSESGGGSAGQGRRSGHGRGGDAGRQGSGSESGGGSAGHGRRSGHGRGGDAGRQGSGSESGGGSAGHERRSGHGRGADAGRGAAY